MNIYDEALKELKDVDTDLHEMAEDYVPNYNIGLIGNVLERAKKEHELLELYKKIFTKLQFETEVDSYDDSWGMCQDVEILKSSNTDVEMWTGDNDIIDLFNQIKALEEELNATSKL